MAEINRIEGSVPPQQPRSTQQTEKKRESSQSDAFVRSEGINIAELIRMAKESPEVRQQLVDQIREAIEKNVYNVDPERIAKRLLREL